MTKYAAGVLVLILGAGILHAADLPLGHPDFMPSDAHPVGFRGDGSGVFPGATPPTQWQDRYGGELGSNVLWKTHMPGWTVSSPIVVGTRVFTVAEPDLLLCVDSRTGAILWQQQVDHLVLWPADEAKGARAAWSNELANLYAFWTTGQELAFVNGAWRENIGVEKQIPALAIADAAARKARLDARIAERAWTFDTAGCRQGYDLNWNMFASEKHKAVTNQEALARLTARMELFTKYGFNFEQWRGWLGNTFRTPASDGRHVYVAMAYGQVACYDLDGKLKWMQFLHPGGNGYTPGKDLRHPAQECGHCPSPLLAGDRLIIHGKGFGSGPDGRKNRVVALNKHTGEILWEVRTGSLKRDVGAPQAMRVNGVDLIVLSTGVILNAADGRILCEDAIGTPGTRIANLAVDGDRAFFNWCATTDGKRDENYIEALQFVVDGAASLTVRPLWRAAVPNCDRVGPTLHAGLLYAGGSAFYAVSAADGTVTELLKDDKRKRCDGNTPPSVVGDNAFWVAGHDAKVLVTTAGKDARAVRRNEMVIDVRVDFDAVKSGKLSLDEYLRRYGGNQDRFPMVYAMCGGPFFQGKRLYLRSNEYLYCIGEE